MEWMNISIWLLFQSELLKKNDHETYFLSVT